MACLRLVCGLRYVWGRPTWPRQARAILAGEPIKVFNHGKMQRDFTYIDDIVEVLRCCDKPATANAAFDRTPGPATAAAPHRGQHRQQSTNTVTSFY